jgi:hypothetical protein
MSAVSAVRPSFFEGQYLGAEDLKAIVDYFRSRDARALLSSHGWGIAAGLQLVLSEIAPGEFQLTVTPGVAIDGYGRLVTVTEPTAAPTEKLLGIATGPVKIWLRYGETPIREGRAGFASCGAEDEFARIEESFVIEVGERVGIADRQSGVTVAGSPIADAREAARVSDPEAPLHCDGSVPYQTFPDDDEDAIWLIPLGIAAWQSASNSFVEPTEDLIVEGRLFRRDMGAVTEDILAANGLLRLRDRASPFTEDIGAACDERGAKPADFIICDGALKARELIWLEGPTRATGDLRLFGTRLEFRDADGRDYFDRVAGGVAITRIDPLLIDRAANLKGGDDLRVLVGPSAAGTNRFAVCSASLTGSSPCDMGVEGVPKVVVAQDGSVGIGTAEAPDSDLAAPLTVRAREADIAILDPEGAAATETVFKLAEFEQADGTVGWGLELWTDGESLALNRRAARAGTLFLGADGNVGIGTTGPEARLEVSGMPTAVSGGLGNNLWFRLGDGGVEGDSGRMWVEYGAQSAPLLVLSDHDDPPRMQFQQTGAGGDEFAPDHATWIGHLTGSTADFGIVGTGRLGLRTETPFTDVTIEGTLGFKPGAAPLVFMFESGTSNADRMILAHSPAFPSWGLRYDDVGDVFRFQPSDGTATMAVNLNTGSVGIGTESPAAELDVRGSIRLGDAGELFALGAAPNLRVVAGEINSGGALARGLAVSASRTSTGQYSLTFSPAFSSPPFVVATGLGNSDNVVSVSDLAADGCTIRCYDTNGGDGEEPGFRDTAFMFIAMGGR